MGNDSSAFQEQCRVESEYVSVGDWRLHDGVWRNDKDQTTKISMLEKWLTTESGSSRPKRDTETYENATKALKIYRHPFIVKYYDAGSRVNSVYMTTERVQPLAKVLEQLSPLEICVGLHCVMQALAFCHDTCKVRHNNFGMDSIFVTPDGTWKLAGMEFSVLQSSYDEEFLQRTRAFRVESVIPPEEKEGSFRHLKSHGHAGDVYALGLFAKITLDYLIETAPDFPLAKEFLDRIRKEVLVADPTSRPLIRDLLEDNFFQHDFISIYTFLRNLAVKEDEEKEVFFRTLAPRLLCLPEKLTAARLSDLLLSRFVLLDSTAKTSFLPHLLRPCTESKRSNEFVQNQTNPIFTVTVFKEHIVPNLLYIFNVQDLNIRTVLLTHFEHYVHLFDKDILAAKILPQILLGIKDVNDSLVSASLHSLALVVLVLGGETVIGPKRGHHFSHSGPKALNAQPVLQPTCLSDIVGESIASPPLLRRSSSTTMASTPLQLCATSSATISNGDLDIRGRPSNTTPMPLISQTLRPSLLCDDDGLLRFDADSKPAPSELERSSPDGSESSEHLTPVSGTDPGPEADWSDWEELPVHVDKPDTFVATTAKEATEPDENSLLRVQAPPPPLETLRVSAPAVRVKPESGLGQEFDIMAIKILPRSQAASGGETDFFVDMQPVIRNVVAAQQEVPPAVDISRPSYGHKHNRGQSFAVEDNGEDVTGGWGDDLEWSGEL